MPVATEKSTFDNACSRTFWYLSVSALIEQFSFVSALNVLLETWWSSTADAQITYYT